MPKNCTFIYYQSLDIIKKGSKSGHFTLEKGKIQRFWHGKKEQIGLFCPGKMEDLALKTLEKWNKKANFALEKWMVALGHEYNMFIINALQKNC